MALAPQVVDVLNEQINREFYSAYLYLTFADYFDMRGLKGFANWYSVQAQEERDHAMAFRRYLLDNDAVPVMEAVEKPELVGESDLGVLEEGLAHEEFVTNLIHNCYTVAHEIHDVRTMRMLDYFIKEQGEEEATAREMVTNMKLFGSDPRGLFSLDRELMTRTYTAFTALPM